MKVAVCVSGLPTSGKSRDITLNFRSVKNKFPSADFYFATWESYLDRAKKLYPSYDILSLKEPPLLYHPYEDAPAEYMKNEKFAKMVKQSKSNPKSRETFFHQAKQIIAHAEIASRIQNQYDVLVRVRYDTFVSTKAKFDSYIIQSFENKCAYGFAWMPGKTDFNTEEIQKDTHYSKNFLFDQLIIHKSDMINHSYVYNLFENKRLLPAEFGWWQVLSEPYNSNHVCVQGWANPDKSVDDKYFERFVS